MAERLSDRVGDRRRGTRDRRRGRSALGRRLAGRVRGRRDVVALAGQRPAEEPDLVADDVAARGTGHAQCRDTELGRPQPDDRAARGDPAAARGGAAPAAPPWPPPRSRPSPRTAAARPNTRPTAPKRCTTSGSTVGGSGSSAPTPRATRSSSRAVCAHAGQLVRWRRTRSDCSPPATWATYAARSSARLRQRSPAS